jgi:cytochrome c peroxidase
MRGSILAVVAAVAGCSSPAAPMTEQELGRALFFDPALSEPAGQACADCHSDKMFFSDPEDERSSAGAIRDRFGFRNAPTAMYARFAPPLGHDAAGRYTGGLFWDGRASTLEEQAGGPLLNPIEMNNPSKQRVVEKVRRAAYARGFRDVYGAKALDDVDAAFASVTRALAAFERTPAFAPFASRYDRYLAGTGTLTAEEQRGLAAFEDPARGNCASCHPSRPGKGGTPPLFTNHAYANLGLPRWGNSPFYRLPTELNPDGEAFVDRGLGKTTGDARHDGQFRVPTLRNVARTFPYGHNGYFQTLREVVAFLSAREVAPCGKTADPSCTAPEVPANVEPWVGRLGLSPADVDDLVAFLGALTDEPAAAAAPAATASR